MSNNYYLNDDHSVTPCDINRWSEQYEEMSRNNTKHVGNDKIDGKHISTVWLGTNYRYGEGPPEIFETMVFKDGTLSDIYCERYATWDEAVDGHKRAIAWVLHGCKDDETE